jgi:hypothetical protein
MDSRSLMRVESPHHSDYTTLACRVILPRSTNGLLLNPPSRLAVLHFVLAKS